MANRKSKVETVVNQQILRSAFEGKKVFVTGHTGFKGAWFCMLLNALGARVKGYALEPAGQPALYDLLQPLDVSHSVIADIRDKKRLHYELERFAPDYIFHLAAQPLVRRSYEIPAETFEVNAIGTANLLEALRGLAGKCTTLIITTDKVYENIEQNIAYKETDRLGGYDPYSASKACTEIVVDAFRNSFFNTGTYAAHQKAVASVRAGNVIGGGDFSQDRILPDIVRALEQQEPIAVRNPDAVRPWQHVLEPLTGYLQLARNLSQDLSLSGAYNFGPRPADHLPVRSLVDQAIQAWGSGSWTDVSDPAQPHEAGLLQLDIEKALTVLNWQPRLDAITAIQWTIDWYKAVATDTNAALAITQQQIAAYWS
ncbi:CDP-glucose 4,6-dehydratase [Niabella terrae]